MVDTLYEGKPTPAATSLVPHYVVTFSDWQGSFCVRDLEDVERVLDSDRARFWLRRMSVHGVHVRLAAHWYVGRF